MQRITLAVHRLLSASLLLVSGDALALPFEPNPTSFARYLSHISWQDGKKRTFSDFRQCAGNDRGFYYCKYGYVTINDPVRGRIFCELQPDAANLHAAFVLGSIVKHGSAYPCRSK